MKIAVIGIGYVGAVTSACLCQSGHDVTAIDIDITKIDAINAGHSPITEKNLTPLIQKYVTNNKLRASSDIQRAIQNTDISLICVGTPSNQDGSLNLEYVKDVCKKIGSALSESHNFHTIVFRSTMLPGSAEEVCLPLIEKYSGKKLGKDFGFGFNPEFLREGTAIEDYFNPPKIVVGAQDKKSTEIIMSLYDGIKAPRIATEIKIAEGVKYADNVWHALKIGFANEMGNILSEQGIDSHKVIDIFCQDKKLNISTAYLKPGFAYGGSCLPKDLRAIRALGNNLGLKTPIFDALNTANDHQIERAYQKIKQLAPKNILLLGLSFKADTDDTRESPLLSLSEKIIKGEFNLKIHDPLVENLKTDFLNDQYFTKTVDPSQYDLIIIGNKSASFKSIIEQAQKQKIKVVDLVRLSPEIENKEGYYGLCW
jgi:GDP-mannose 6-dehydrogenase